MAKNVRTKKQGRVTIDELNALNNAYGEDLGSKEYLTYVLVPGIGFLAFGTLLLYNPIVSVTMFILGVLYGWLFLLPKSIAKAFEKQSFAQRNKFINNMTQVMTDSSKTVLDALSAVIIRADGKFKDDLMRLQAGIFGADRQGIKDAFNEISGMYEEDIIFTQYMEQVETAALEGNSNVETLKDIKNYHNQMKTKQEDYETLKQSHLGDMKIMMFTITIFILALTFSFGFETYLSAFARAPAGWITCGIYMSIIGFFFKQFNGYLFDDSVTSIRAN